jgi:hypothetical protein
MKTPAVLCITALAFLAGFCLATLLLGRYQIELTQEHNSLGSETVCYRLDRLTGTCEVHATSFKGCWYRLREPPPGKPFEPVFTPPKPVPDQ